MNETKDIIGAANKSMAQLITSINEISKASEETFKIISERQKGSRVHP